MGIARADAVSGADAAALDAWVDAGLNADMAYMARNREVRLDPRLLMPGVHSVISMAFSYRPPGGYRHSAIADYALGRDYHRVIKGRLAPVVEMLSAHYGALSRICVDSAPMLERYWAAQAGVGFVGRNRCLIVPGVGPSVFLAEIITTLELVADTPLADGCGDCQRCVTACPGASLGSDRFGTTTCRSYLTIESRDGIAEPLPVGAKIYGCDICTRICPHGRGEPPEPLPELLPDPRLLAIDRNALAQITTGDFRRLFRYSAISRITARKMRHNSR